MSDTTTATAAYGSIAVEERTRHWLEANYLAAIAQFHERTQSVYGDDGQPRNLNRYAFQEVQRKLKIFRWLDRLDFDSFIDIGSGFDQYPNFVHERYGVPAYWADFAHSLNLPYGGAEHGKLDHATTLNIARLPFADDTFDVVLSSEVLEHLVRPLECIAELMRVARKYVIMTSLEALAANRWQRWRAHFRVDVRQPHVERNFFLLHELAAVFGPEWRHENLFYDRDLPASGFAAPEAQEAAYRSLRDVDAFAGALCRAVAVTDHRAGAMGILIVKAKPGAVVRPAAGDDGALARWLIERTARGQRDGARLVEQIRNGTAPFTDRARPIAPALLALLRCPDCRAALAPEGSGVRCRGCGTAFAGEYGVPILYPKRSLLKPAPEDEWLPRLSAGDRQRQQIVRRVAQRLHRNERPPGPLRQWLWRLGV
jgi:SAM-dependent methyltransferase